MASIVRKALVLAGMCGALYVSPSQGAAADAESCNEIMCWPELEECTYQMAYYICITWCTSTTEYQCGYDSQCGDDIAILCLTD